jgi:hypothetical protein
MMPLGAFLRACCFNADLVMGNRSDQIKVWLKSAPAIAAVNGGLKKGFKFSENGSSSTLNKVIVCAYPLGPFADPVYSLQLETVTPY